MEYTATEMKQIINENQYKIAETTEKNQYLITEIDKLKNENKELKEKIKKIESEKRDLELNFFNERITSARLQGSCATFEFCIRNLIKKEEI